MTRAKQRKVGARMLGFVTPVGRNAADPLSDVAAADAFWQNVPRTDPVAAQKAVCGALADLMARGNPNIVRLRALLAIDQRARKLVDALLVNYGAADAESTALERPYWQSAFELCRSFGDVHSHFLRSMRDSLVYRGWREYLPSVLLRLFQHRQIELLLRPFVNESSTRFSWNELHEAYQHADSRGLLREALTVSRCRSKRPEESTLEREYIHVLLLDLMNGGQFPPHDAFWVSQKIPRWCAALRLESGNVRDAEHRFVVDLDGAAGPARLALESAGTSLYLDTAPVLETIRDETAALRNASDPAHDFSRRGRGRQLKVTRRLTALYAPKPPLVARRGERKPAAQTVETVIGLAQIIRALRHMPPEPAVAPPPEVPEIEEITITAFGGFTGVPTGGFLADGSTISPRSSGNPDTGYPLWKLADRSESGCRLQGQIFGSNWVTPGALVAFREDPLAPWTLAVVRRVEKRGGNRVDIGVEYVGKNPRGVMVTVDADADADESSAGPQDAARPRFAAVYLPESKKHPVMPIKTLVLPVQKFVPRDRLTLRSAASIYTILLKEPIEEQGDFTWSPFEVVDRRPAEGAALAGTTSGPTR